MSKTSRLLKVILAVIIATILVISANFCLFNADRCVLASEGASQRIEFTTPQGPSSASYTNYLNSGTGIVGFAECTGEYQPIDWSYNWDFQIPGPADEVLHSWTGHWVNSPHHDFDCTAPRAGEYTIKVSHQSSYSKHIVIEITPAGWELGGGPPLAPAPTPLSVTFNGWYVDGVKITTATTDDTVTARITLSGGEATLYKMRVKRDIVWATDEVIKELSFDYNGVSATKQLSFNPPYATGEASTDGYFVVLVKGSYEVWGLVNAFPPRLRVKTPPPNQPPIAYIDSISPSSTKQGKEVSFSGHGTDPDGSVAGYSWRSSIDGQLSTSSSFTTSNLSEGTHTIYFKVRDNKGLWSSEVSRTLTINPPNRSPTVYIDSILPDRVRVKSEVSFSGHGIDPDGSVVGFSWRSSIDGQLSTSDSFITSNLSEGTHTIYFKVKDNNEAWSEEVSGTVTIETNKPPIACIDSISPSRTEQPEEVSFKGHGTDPDGSVVGYSWRSSIDGQLSTSSFFSTSGLSVGKHIIYLKVKDNDGLWSEEVTGTLTVDRPGPYVELYGHRTEVNVGEEIILNLSVVNSITSPGNLIVQLTLSIPSGWSITSSGFGHGAGGLCTNTYEVEQGPNPRTISVQILANEPYDGVVSGYLDYYFVKEEEYKYHKDITLPVTATSLPPTPEERRPAPTEGGGFSCSGPVEGSAPPPTEELLISWGLIGLCWGSLAGGLGIMKWRRRK